uniref:Nucleolar complex protein 3 homolog n=1 Tax=Mucochytrium quahogii TaxID=96639 RepID=A0A7S2SHN8_9STRA|mmetsp:Transcript_7666/g.14113  ORF Transcript_7666/g.14113 Transcript_7666/m.14113 type:complete len:746 (+) Transcript_7666:196-2433(+)|eukprot:CAMPEP_0203762962 /NCGR_PEP_ID=MMETSP0098-20131031/15716_1 /ASSEMBLY_ACC=CAM_ASM_000208 /TAXON_ID=96639 /ORGANISM=" , Strain NY0313808BC1" /LENGTH=745 /DNA_ID=CAMNT_0050657563 /DNA_START=190 /DNA_END=2427 /DNA_ORIENTATION=-
MSSSEDEEGSMDPMNFKFLESRDLGGEEKKSKKRNRKKKTPSVVEQDDKESDEFDDGDSDEEAEFEKTTRMTASSTNRWLTTDVEKLPVKMSTGELTHSKLDEEERHAMGRPDGISLVWKKGEREGDDEEEEEEDDEEALESERQKEKAVPEKLKLNAAQMLIRRDEVKLEIASLAQETLADPEASVQQQKSRGGGSAVGRLIHIASTDEDQTLRKLAILSLVAVFKDILPEYRIRLPSEKEKATTLTKQVRLLRRFERGMLENYQRFLQLLYGIVVERLGALNKSFDHTTAIENEKSSFLRRKKKVKVDKYISLAVVAVRGLCTMLVAKPQFNFRENLMANIIPRMNSPIEEVRQQCCACITTILQEDVTGDTTLEIVVYISKYVRSHNNGSNGSIHPSVLQCLLRCSLNADLKDTIRREQMEDKRRTKKKRKKMRDEIAQNMEEAEATADPYHRHAKQLEALRELFTMYLRVLKRAPQSLIMPVVLRGVARYVHLINLDIAQAVVTVLTQLVKSDQLPIEAGLQSVHTIALTLRGPGAELNVDESEFVAYLYRMLLKIITSVEERDKYILLIIRCVEATFLGRKQYQFGRIAAMVTRLSVLALFVSPHATLALVAVVRQLMYRYQSICRPLLDSESTLEEGSNSLALGLPPADNENVDLALVENDAPALWPLAQLRFHYQPFVRTFVERALSMTPLLPSERPIKLFSAYNPFREGGFNPPIATTMKQINTKGNRNRKRKQNKN